jgi:hypothetical protein
LKRLVWKVEDNTIPGSTDTRQPKQADSGPAITLAPMQIRTFILDIVPK